MHATKLYLDSTIFGIGTKRLLREVFMDTEQEYNTYKTLKELNIHNLDDMCRRGLIESYTNEHFCNKKYVEVTFNYEEEKEEEL